MYPWKKEDLLSIWNRCKLSSVNGSMIYKYPGTKYKLYFLFRPSAWGSFNMLECYILTNDQRILPGESPRSYLDYIAFDL